MATVLERFNKLGLASSNSVLSAAGAWVSATYKREQKIFSPNWICDENDKRSMIDQLESDGKTYKVYSYPEDWTQSLDKAIWAFINQNQKLEEVQTQIDRPKRKRIVRDGKAN